MRKSIFAGCLLLLLSACQAKTGTTAKGKDAAGDTAAAPRFPYPEIPPALTSPDERRAYLLEHYWDRFDFADTALVNDRNITEQGFVDFIALMADSSVTAGVVERSMDGLCSRIAAHSETIDVMSALPDDYLYDPNSPFHNERLYAVYLRSMTAMAALDEARRSKLTFRLRLVSRNNVGTRAEDFSYATPDGRRHTLRGTRAEGGRLLLVFYDPECPTCHDVMAQMTGDDALASAVAGGRLTVLAIYTEGDDAVWRRSLADIPDGWTVGSDGRRVQDGALYDLKAMPSLYLLDSDKRVILKDAPYGAIRERLGFD